MNLILFELNTFRTQYFSNFILFELNTFRSCRPISRKMMIFFCPKALQTFSTSHLDRSSGRSRWNWMSETNYKSNYKRILRRFNASHFCMRFPHFMAFLKSLSWFVDVATRHRIIFFMQYNCSAKCDHYWTARRY